MVKYDYESCFPLGAGMDYLEDVRKQEERMNGVSHEEDDYASCSPLGAGMDYLRDYEKQKQKEIMERFWGTKED